MRLKFVCVCLALATLLAAGAGCRSRPESAETPSPSAATDASPSPSTPTNTAATSPSTAKPAPTSRPETETAQGTALSSGQTAVLTAQEADAQINLRSQPTTDADIRGYGVVGDVVILLRSTEQADGYTWYYVQFEASDAEGWIRGDFIETDTEVATRPEAATTEDALGEAIDSVCGGPEAIETYYGTTHYDVYICRRGDNWIYVGSEKDTRQTLVTDNVRATDAGYIAVEGSYEYHINDSDLVVYRVDDDGNYTQVMQEPVTTTE